MQVAFRAMTKIRGSLVTTIFRKMLKIRAESTNSSAASTYSWFLPTGRLGSIEMSVSFRAPDPPHPPPFRVSELR